MGVLSSIILGTAALAKGVTDGIAGKQQGDYQAQQFEANARLADISAEDSTRRGDVAAGQYQNKAKMVLGGQRAALAASGVDVNSGSAADIQDETQTTAAKDVATIKSNAWREAWGFKVAASNARSQAGQAKAAGDFTFGTSLLTGGIQAAGYFSKKKGE